MSATDQMIRERPRLLHVRVKCREASLASTSQPRRGHDAHRLDAHCVAADQVDGLRQARSRRPFVRKRTPAGVDARRTRGDNVFGFIGAARKQSWHI
jgi:hypothetical protein